MEKARDARLTGFIRRATATPTLGIFRVFNFELYSRREPRSQC